MKKVMVFIVILAASPAAFTAVDSGTGGSGMVDLSAALQWLASLWF